MILWCARSLIGRLIEGNSRYYIGELATNKMLNGYPAFPEESIPTTLETIPGSWNDLRAFFGFRGQLFGFLPGLDEAGNGLVDLIERVAGVGEGDAFHEAVESALRIHC